jgi:hypothetical protein
MRLTGAVREKFRHCTCLLVAAHRRSPEENMLKAAILKRVEGERNVNNLAAALEAMATGARETLGEVYDGGT